MSDIVKKPENVLVNLATNSDEVDDAIRASADENGIVRAGDLRRRVRGWYDGLKAQGLDWRVRVRELGYTPASGVPRDHWGVPENHIKVLREVATQLGRSPTRQDLIAAGYGSASARLDTHFDGIQGALHAAGLPPAAGSGRPDRWVEDEKKVRALLEKHLDAEGRLPKATRMRKRDSSLEALLRAQHGSWESAAEYYGYEVARARQQWSDEKIESILRSIHEDRKRLTRREVRRLVSPGFLRTVERRYGTLSKLQRGLGVGEDARLWAPQGFVVDSAAELLVAYLLHWLDVPVLRSRLTINGRHVHPDFVITQADKPLIVEVLMVSEDGPARSQKEADYQLRWARKKRLYELQGLDVVVITPQELGDAEALLARLEDACGVETPLTRDELEQQLASLRPYTPPVWTWEMIEEEVRRVAALNDGYMPTQSMLRRLGRRGLLSVITRRGHTLGSLRALLKLPARPKHEAVEPADG